MIKLQGASGKGLASAHAAPVRIGDDGLIEAIRFIAGLGEVTAKSKTGSQGAKEIPGYERGICVAYTGAGLNTW